MLPGDTISMDQPIRIALGNKDQARSQTSGGEEEDMPVRQSCKKRKSEVEMF
jgi:hypothetical protein